MAIFGSKETTGGSVAEATPPQSVADATRVSRLGNGILITGKIEGSETLRVDGRLEGEVDLRADLIIGSQADVRATVHARSITVEGRVAGDLSADQRIDLLHTARVEGTIKSPSISVAEGATFQGRIDMSMRKGSR